MNWIAAPDYEVGPEGITDDTVFLVAARSSLVSDGPVRFFTVTFSDESYWDATVEESLEDMGFEVTHYALITPPVSE